MRQTNLCSLLLVVAALGAGIAAWPGAASWHGGVGFAPLILAGLKIAAPSPFLLGLGAFLLGA